MATAELVKSLDTWCAVSEEAWLMGELDVWGEMFDGRRDAWSFHFTREPRVLMRMELCVEENGEVKGRLLGDKKGGTDARNLIWHLL